MLNGKSLIYIGLLMEIVPEPPDPTFAATMHIIAIFFWLV